MVRRIRFFLFVTFGLVMFSAADEENDCYLPGGALGKCLHIEECDSIFKDISMPYSENALEPIVCSENKVCCRHFPTYVAKEVCRRYVKQLSTKKKIETHIYNGERVTQGEFPHMAALGIVSGKAIQFICGGTLISSRFIMTAAHCVALDNPKFHARLGATEINDIYTRNLDHPVDEVIEHPKYSRISKQNDIALFRLAKDITFLGNVQFPACLQTDVEDPQTEMQIAGWGKTDGSNKGTGSNLLLKASVNKTSPEECSEKLRRPQPFPTEGQICAENKINHADACRGDSGGPLKVSIGNESYTLYKVIGITSFGKSCHTENPGVYTRVSYYLDWIVETVWPDELFLD